MTQHSKRRGIAYNDALALAFWLANLGFMANAWMDFVYLEKSRNAELKDECKAHLVELGKAMEGYLRDNNGRFPPLQIFPLKKNERDDPLNVVKVLRKYVLNDEVFICPSAPDPIQQLGVCYIWNDQLSGKPKAEIRRPSDTWMLADIEALYVALPDQYLQVNQLTPRFIPLPHVRGYNILYVDGKVKWSPVAPKFKVDNMPRNPFQGVMGQPGGGGVGSGS